MKIPATKMLLSTKALRSMMDNPNCTFSNQTLVWHNECWELLEYDGSYYIFTRAEQENN